MEPAKNKPEQQEENPMKGYNPTDRNFQNTQKTPSAKHEDEEEYNDEEVNKEGPQQEETKDQTV